MEEIKTLKNQIKELENQCKEIDKQVEELYTTKNHIFSEINALRYKIEKIRFSKMNIKENSWFIAFEQRDYHYDIFKLLKITFINNNKIEYVMYKYHCADGELSFNVYSDYQSRRGITQIITDNGFQKITKTSAEALIQIGLECKEDTLPDIQYLYD